MDKALSPSSASIAEWPIFSTRLRIPARIAAESSPIRIFIFSRKRFFFPAQIQGYYGCPDASRETAPGADGSQLFSARRSAGGAQQRPDIGDQIRRVALSREKAQPPLRIENVAAGGVIDGVAVGGLARRLLVEHTEGFRSF